MDAFTHSSGKNLCIDGAKIYYEEIGNEDKPALLLLHGGFQTIEDLNPIVSYLAKDFYIIGIDSRGHGKSTLGDAALTYERMQHDAEAVLKHLTISSASILGFSDGGTVALRIAAEKNIKIEKLIAIGSSWSVNELASTEMLYQEINPESAKGMFGDYFEQYQNMNPEPDFDKFTTQVVALWLDKERTGYPNEKVAAIDSSVLLIRGDNDFLTSITCMAALVDTLNDVSFLNVPFAEHVVYVEQQDVCEAIIRQFLSIMTK